MKMKFTFAYLIFCGLVLSTRTGMVISFTSFLKNGFRKSFVYLAM